jgi:hypothetical protein
MGDENATFRAELSGNMPPSWYAKRLAQHQEYRIEVETGVETTVLKIGGPFSATPDDDLSTIYKNVSDRQKQIKIGDVRNVIDLSETIHDVQTIERICIESVAELRMHRQIDGTAASITLAILGARKMSNEHWAILNQTVSRRFGCIAEAASLRLDPTSLTVT